MSREPTDIVEDELAEKVQKLGDFFRGLEQRNNQWEKKALQFGSGSPIGKVSLQREETE